ncbi:hypothetical protein ACTXT7_016520 [Hymenolepis weldensis]
MSSGVIVTIKNLPKYLSSNKSSNNDAKAFVSLRHELYLTEKDFVSVKTENNIQSAKYFELRRKVNNAYQQLSKYHKCGE